MQVRERRGMGTVAQDAPSADSFFLDAPTSSTFAIVPPLFAEDIKSMGHCPHAHYRRGTGEDTHAHGPLAGREAGGSPLGAQPPERCMGSSATAPAH